MSQVEKGKWDNRYESGEYRSRTAPSALLVSWLHSLPRGRALDIACGLGRNAIYLAGQGYEVEAIDISAVALAQAQRLAQEKGLTIRWIQADLDSYTLPVEAYDVIVNSFYLNRRLAPQMYLALKSGGFLLFEHHFLTPEPVDGPTNPKLRLRPGELPQLFPSLRIAWYKETIAQDEGRKVARAQLVACKASKGNC